MGEDARAERDTTSSMYDVVVIGAGIVGSMIARELSRFDLRLGIVEKEPFPGFGVSKSGLSQLHAPDFCPEGTLKGRLCLNAAVRYRALSCELDVPFRDVDEIWLALKPEHLPNLEAAKARGEAFGAEGFEIITPERIRELEPHLNPDAVAALYVRGLGVIYPPEWTFALTENAVQNGTELFLNTVVTGISSEEGYHIIHTDGKDLKTRFIINAAGLFADEIARMIGDDDIRLILTKGVMAIFDRNTEPAIRHMVYGTFSAEHSQAIAPTVHGNLIAGLGRFTVPVSKSDTAVPQGKLREVLDMARELVPELSPRDVITSFAGIRSENNKVEKGDFYIAQSEKTPGVIHAVIGSPGLTAAPAIADYVRNMLGDIGCRLEEQPDFRKNRSSWPRFSVAGVEELEALTAENPKYGRVLCRCETVTEAEIEQAIRRGADTTDAVKHVTRAGMGRCQGGFCGPSVLNALCKHLNAPPENVTKKGKGSSIVNRTLHDRNPNVS